MRATGRFPLEVRRSAANVAAVNSRQSGFVHWAIGASLTLLAPGVWAENDEDPFALESDATPPASTSGPELGLRLGLSTGSGQLEESGPLRERIAGMLPLWVDAGYRLYDRWFLGVYWQYGLGLSSSSSDAECESCVHSAIKYGLQINYSFLTTPAARVWAGIGAGHQSFETVDEQTKRGVAFAGWEPVSLHVGSSWRPVEGVEIGPYFTWAYSTIGSKSNVCYEPDRGRCPPEEAVDFSDSSTILWSTFGIRAVFLP